MSQNIPFQHIDWTLVPKQEYRGETGSAFWQTIQFDGLRIRLVEYLAGYLADHWCQKGHFVYCEPPRDCRRPKTLRQYPYEKQTIRGRS